MREKIVLFVNELWPWKLQSFQIFTKRKIKFVSELTSAVVVAGAACCFPFAIFQILYDISYSFPRFAFFSADFSVNDWKWNESSWTRKVFARERKERQLNYFCHWKTNLGGEGERRA